MYPVGILEKDQSPQDQPRHFVKRSAAKYLEAHGLAISLGRNLLKLLIGLKRGLANPVMELVRRRKQSDSGELLDPLAWYMPWVPVPEWILRSYRGKAA